MNGLAEKNRPFSVIFAPHFHFFKSLYVFEKVKIIKSWLSKECPKLD